MTSALLKVRQEGRRGGRYRRSQAARPSITAALMSNLRSFVRRLKVRDTAYEQTWSLMFRYHKPGAAFDFQELAVTAGRDVAFAVAIMRCGPDSSSNPADKDGFLFRLTVGLRKVGSEWRISHEHHSVPATD